MSIATGLQLIVALLLPWLVGYLLATAVLRLFRRHEYGLLIRLGYGFLIGQLLVGGLMVAIDGMGFGIGFYPVIAALGVIGGAAWWAARRLPGFSPALLEPHDKRPPPATAWRLSEALLVGLFLLLILAHWAPSAIEVWWRPLYPWDAWALWGYRAKAWFFQGELTPFVSPEQWLRSPEGAYPIHGHHYPTLVSLLQTWIALSLEQWHESLINLPWLLVPIALGLIIYGQLRMLGLSRVMALIPVYLMISMPMIHTHIALAGYADIWQAAYTSGGFIAFVAGVRNGDRFWQLWGLLFVIFGVWIKSEGAVWLFLLGLTGVLAMLRGWAWAALAGLFAVTVTLVLHQLDLTLELPYLGRVGIADNMLYLPAIPPQQLAYNDVWGPFGLNLFVYNNWHLLWYLMPVFLGMALARWNRATSYRVRGLAIAAPVVAIFAIFLLTAQGAWAENYTAINRLFIHFVPLWVFIFFTLWQDMMPQPGDQDSSRNAAHARG